MEQKSLTFFPNRDPDNSKYQKLIADTQNYISNIPSPINASPFLKCLKERQFSRALRQACSFELDYLTRILLDYLNRVYGSAGDFINDQSPSNGQTALHWAASSAQKTKKINILLTLLEYQPNPPAIRDNEGCLYSDYLDDTLKEKLKAGSESQYFDCGSKPL